MDVSTMLCIAGILCSSGGKSGENTEKSPEKRVAKRWAFGSDKQISEFLDWYHTDVMIWTCRNTVKHQWSAKSSSSIELYCEVLGSVTSLEWYRGDEKIKLGSKYKLVAFPHYRKGHYYGKWIDYRLQIADPKPSDSGQYNVIAKGLKGKKDSQVVFVDISDKKPEVAAQTSSIADKTVSKVKDLKETKTRKLRNKKTKEARRRKNRRRKNRKRNRGHRRRGGRNKKRRNKKRKDRKRGRKHRGQRKHRRPKSKTIFTGTTETPKVKSNKTIAAMQKLFPSTVTTSKFHRLINETNDTIVGV